NDSDCHERPADRDDARRADGGRISQARLGGLRRYFMADPVSARGAGALGVGGGLLSGRSGPAASWRWRGEKPETGPPPPPGRRLKSTRAPAGESHAFPAVRV